MKRISGAIAAMVISCACCFGAAQGTPTATDLGSLERVLETTYHLHGQRVPMMGLVNGFAHIVTKGGVSGMRVVTYENLPTGLDHRAMGELARKHLGTDWSLMVRQTATGSGDNDLVFVQPAGKRVRMLVMNLDSNELNVVQMELSPEDLKKWEDQHGG
jgi:hypothetical protein